MNALQKRDDAPAPATQGARELQLPASDPSRDEIGRPLIWRLELVKKQRGVVVPAISPPALALRPITMPATRHSFYICGMAALALIFALAVVSGSPAAIVTAGMFALIAISWAGLYDDKGHEN